jgi:hypothetical protein
MNSILSNYIGKTIECISSGNEFIIEEHHVFYDSRPYTKEIWVTDDEGEKQALVWDGKTWAKIIENQENN